MPLLHNQKRKGGEALRIINQHTKIEVMKKASIILFFFAMYLASAFGQDNLNTTRIGVWPYGPGNAVAATAAPSRFMNTPTRSSPNCQEKFLWMT